MFKVRPVAVPGWRTFQVHPYIVRIDIDEPGYTGTHGWQLRYDKPFVFFSDRPAKRRPLGSPATSLKRATTRLKEIYEGHRPRLRDTEFKSKGLHFGVPGLRCYSKKRPTKNLTEWYMELSHPLKSHAAKRIYVGTDNTITLPRIDAAFMLLVDLREAQVAEHRNKIQQESLRQMPFPAR